MLSIDNNSFWLTQAAEKFGQDLFIVSKKNKLKFGEFILQVRSLANQLSDIKKGERIALQFDDPVQSFIHVCAVWSKGGLPVLLSPKLTETETDFLIKEINPCRGLSINPGYSNTKIEPDQINNFEFNKSEDAIVIFTSGSTDKPKAVLHTFNSLFNSAQNTDSIINAKPGDAWLASLPHYHIGGFMIFIRAFLTGNRVVIPENLKAKTLTDALGQHEINFCSFVQTSMQRLFEYEINTSSIKATFLGGGKIDSEIMYKANELGWNPVKVYGSSETCSMVTALTFEQFQQKPESAGLPIGENKIFTDQAEGQASGEIVIESGSIMSGYLNYSNELIRKGKLSTGDLGFIDDDGFLFITGRMENFIISGGENIIPLEIENEIMKFPGIDDCAVIGVEDQEWGEKIAAAIAAKQKIEINELVKFLKSNLSSIKIPKEFIFLGALPKNEMGKTDIKALKKLFA